MSETHPDVGHGFVRGAIDQGREHARALEGAGVFSVQETVFSPRARASAGV